MKINLPVQPSHLHISVVKLQIIMKRVKINAAFLVPTSQLLGTDTNKGHCSNKASNSVKYLLLT